MSLKTISFTFVMGLFALSVGGCNCSKKLASAQAQNKALTQRVAELEDQLKKADEPIYVVCEGDSLWSIAEKQLGSGTRYKEILALNPQLENEHVSIGTILKMPPQ